LLRRDNRAVAASLQGFRVSLHVMMRGPGDAPRQLPQMHHAVVITATKLLKNSLIARGISMAQTALITGGK